MLKQNRCVVKGSLGDARAMYVAMLWYGQVNLVSLQKLIVVPLSCWSVLDGFKRVKCWECH